MQHVTIHAAKTQLSRLIAAAVAGEEVVIVKGGKPIVRLAPIPQGRFTIGLLADRLSGPTPDFLTPMAEDELRLWDGGV
jgi:prevent-host-death family protein